jgi:UDP-glucose 4-epimerase
MKVLLTGGAGYIGSSTARLLQQEGVRVSVIDNFERGHREALPNDIDVFEVDLRNAERVSAALSQVRPDAVIHFAAYAYVGESMDQPLKYFENNVNGGINLVNACVQAGVKKIVFSSSCATYGVPGKLPITEHTPQVPSNPYGETKLILEKVLGWAEEIHGLQAVMLRYFNACGADGDLGEDHDPETHLIPLILQAAAGVREEICVFGDDYPTSDGTCVRDYIHIKDLAVAHQLALSEGVCGAFNLGTGKGHSVMEVIRCAEKVTGRDIPVRMCPRRAGDPPELVAAVEKARKELGWSARYSELEEILSDAWNWMCSHPQGYRR